MSRAGAVIGARRPRATSMSAAVFGAALLASVVGVQAAQNAHEHGKGELNVVVDGPSVGLELRVPGVDVVGFEHKARTQEEKAAVVAAVERFSSPEHLFKLTAAAQCVVIKAAASLGGEHAAHGHAAKDNHGHVDKHEQHEQHEEHSELRAEYFFECAAPTLLNRLVVNVFDLLSAKALRAAVVTEQGQTAVELTPAARSIDFRP